MKRTFILIVAAFLLTPLVTLLAADPPPKRPLLLANYYCWYHDGQHLKQPFLHWTHPTSTTNALAKKAQKPTEPPRKHSLSGGTEMMTGHQTASGQ